MCVDVFVSVSVSAPVSLCVCRVCRVCDMCIVGAGSRVSNESYRASFSFASLYAASVLETRSPPIKLRSIAGHPSRIPLYP